MWDSVPTFLDRLIYLPPIPCLSSLACWEPRGSSLGAGLLPTYLPATVEVMSVHVWDYERRMTRLSVLLASVRVSLERVNALNEQARTAVARAGIRVVDE